MKWFQRTREQSSPDEVDVTRLKGRVERLRPYLIRRASERTPGAFAALDAAGHLGEELAALTSEPVASFAADWERLLAPIIDSVVQPLLGNRVAEFEKRVAAAGQRVLARYGPGAPESDRLGEVLDLFGGHVGGEMANFAWQHGYACCMARIVLEGRMRSTPHAWPQYPDPHVISRAFYLIHLEPAEFIGFGTTPPLGAPLIADVLSWMSGELFRRLSPFFLADEASDARDELLLITVAGHAIARSQLEPRLIEQVMPMSVRTMV